MENETSVLVAVSEDDSKSSIGTYVITDESGRPMYGYPV